MGKNEICQFCKKPILDAKDAGHYAMGGGFHKSCMLKKSGIAGMALGAIFFIHEDASGKSYGMFGALMLAFFVISAIAATLFLSKTPGVSAHQLGFFVALFVYFLPPAFLLAWIYYRNWILKAIWDARKII